MTEPRPMGTGRRSLLALLVGLTAAFGVARAFQWTQGLIGNALVMLSALATVAVWFISKDLGWTRAQVVVVSLVIVTVFAGVLALAFLFGREERTAETFELAPPDPRGLDEISSPCDVPALEDLTQGEMSRIVASRAIQATDSDGDFVAALAAPASAESAFPDDVTLTVLECDGTTWAPVMEQQFGVEGCATELTTTQLRTHEQEEALLTTTCGSGGYVEYSLIGFDEQAQSIRTLHTVDDPVFAGDVAQLRDRLVVEGGGGARSELIWDGEQFTAQGEASTAPAQAGLIVEFWWEPTGGKTSLPVVRVLKDERVYFNWDRESNTDDGVTSYRMLASIGSGPAGFEEDERGEQYLVLNEGGLSVEVTVIPNGYDIENAIELTVNS